VEELTPQSRTAALPLGLQEVLSRVSTYSSGLVLLALAVLCYFLIQKYAPPSFAADLEWYTFGFQDKRSVSFIYWASVFIFLFWPLAATRGLGLRGPRVHSLQDAGQPVAFSRRLLDTGLAIALIAFLFGPPWNVWQLQRPLEIHEMIHLGPLQAALRGKAFYTHTGTQYAPGMLFLLFQYMKRYGASVLSLREAWLLFNFAGALWAAAWMGWTFRRRVAVLGIVLSAFFSPLFFYGFTPAGTMDAFFGWAALLRYVGAVTFIFGLSRIFVRGEAMGSPWLRTAALGAMWGLFALLAQESLGCGLSGAGILVLLFWLSGTRRFAELTRISGVVLIGFLVVWIPVLAIYLARGELLLFLERYSGVAKYVVRGYSNTGFPGEPWARMYYLMPIFSIGSALFALYARRLEPRGRGILLGSSAALLACYAPSLFRADKYHLIVTLLAFVWVICALVENLWVDQVRRTPDARWAKALLGLAVLMMPLDAFQHYSWAGRVRSFWIPFQPKMSREAWVRVGFDYDPNWSIDRFSRMTIAEYKKLSQDLHAFVGGRPALVSSFFFRSGQVYFFADLTPVGSDPEPTLTIVNSELKRRQLEALKGDAIPCLIWVKPDDPEIRLFKAQGKPYELRVFPTRDGGVSAACLSG